LLKALIDKGYRGLACLTFNSSHLLIEIDAEGHEWHILSGLIPIIDQEQPAIYVEAREDTYELVYRLMHDHGYTKAYTCSM